jgi:hypothetical protein
MKKRAASSSDKPGGRLWLLKWLLLLALMVLLLLALMYPETAYSQCTRSDGDHPREPGVKTVLRSQKQA